VLRSHGLVRSTQEWIADELADPMLLRHGHAINTSQYLGPRLFLAARSEHIVIVRPGQTVSAETFSPDFSFFCCTGEEYPMTHAIRFHQTGGPEVLVWEGVEVGKPGPGEARIRHTAVGLNFVDIYVRSGLYPTQLPSGLGSEAAGVVLELGPGVTDLKAGDRVAYGSSPLGAYAEERLIPADRLIKLPDGIDDKTAAAMMLKGLTVQYLIRQTHRVKSGETILLHAAAGGIGLILGQWAKHLGATVIGTVGSDEKAKLAQAHGCAHTIVYSREDFVKRVEEITDGKKVPVVYDSVGKDTFLKSLDCLAPLGLVALFGQSSGSVEPLNLGLLAQKGSLYVTRPTLNTYGAKRENLVAMAKELFDVVLSGAVKIEVNQTYPLKDAAKAHADLAARKTTGSTVLLV
jgi:NADPH:quinone reductase